MSTGVHSRDAGIRQVGTGLEGLAPGVEMGRGIAVLGTRLCLSKSILHLGGRQMEKKGGAIKVLCKECERV